MVTSWKWKKPGRVPGALCVNALVRLQLRGRGLSIGPKPQEVVINAGEAHERGMARRIAAELLNGSVQLEQDIALGFFPHHALNPEKGSEAGAACDRLDAMHAGAGIEHHVAGAELHPLGACGRFDDQFATV